MNLKQRLKELENDLKTETQILKNMPAYNINMSWKEIRTIRNQHALVDSIQSSIDANRMVQVMQGDGKLRKPTLYK